MPKYTLHYFGGNGRAVIARAILTFVKADWENVAIKREDWPKIKTSGLCEYEQVPVLEVDGKKYLDTGLLSGSLILYSMPTFWFAMLLIFLFCVTFRIFPTGGIFTAGTAYHGWALVKDYLRHMALPSLCMGFAMVGCYAVTMRSTMIGILTEDYITTARAKGFSTRYILMKHAIPNAMLPMATIIAMNIAFILGGAIQLETLFSWKGLGQLMYLALDKRDFPMLQGCFLISTLAVILANFIMDILYGFIDPRVKE